MRTARLAPFVLLLASVNTVGAQEQLRVDPYGDTLPAGAVARIGSVRLRHPGLLYDLQVTGDGKRLVSRDYYGLRIWDVTTGAQLATIRDDDVPYSLAAAPTGALIAMGTGLGNVGIWNSATGKRLARLGADSRDTVAALALAPDGKTLAAGQSNQVTLWDWTTQRALRTVDHKEPILSLAFSSDAKTLVSASQHVIRFWDVVRGIEIRREQEPLNSWIDRVELSPDGKHLAATCWSNAYLYDLRQAPAKITHIARGSCIRFAADGRAGICDEQDGLTVADVTGNKQRWSTVPHRPRFLAFFPDGKTLAAMGSSGAIHLWDSATGKEKLARPGHDTGPDAALFAADGKSLYTCGSGPLCRWDARTGKLVGSLDQRGTLLPSSLPGVPAYRFAAGSCTVWEAETGKPIAKFTDEAFRLGFSAMAVASDGKFAAISGPHGLTLKNLTTNQEIPWPGGPRAEATQLTFSPDSKVLSICDRDQPVLRFLALANGKELRSIDYSREQEHCHISTTAFAPDGRRLAVGLLDAPSRVIAVASGKPLVALPEGLTALAFSADGLLLTGGSKDGTVHVWEAATGNELRRWHGHQDAIVHLAFSPQGDRLVSSSGDGTALIWNLAPPSRFADRMQGVQDSVTAKHLEQWWTELAHPDARKAFRALWTMAALPHRALPFVQARLPAASSMSAVHVRQLVRDLDDADADVRQAATDALVKHPGAEEKYLRQVLAKPSSLEAQRRLQHVLERWDELPNGAEDLRRLRALQLLAAIDQPASWGLLDTYAKAKSHRPLTAAASALLARKSLRGAVVWMPGGADPEPVKPAVDMAQVRTLAGADKDATVRALAFSPNGERLASVAADGKVRLWSTGTGKQLKEFPGGLFSVAFSPDGKVLAWGTEPGRIELWHQGKRQMLPALAGHTDLVMAVAFSADGKQLVSGSWDGTVRLWDWMRGETVRTFDNQGDPVETLALSADGARLYVGGVTDNRVFANCPVLESARIRLFDVATAKLLCKWNGGATELALTPDGRTLLTGAVATSFVRDPKASGAIQIDDIVISSRAAVHLWDTAGATRRAAYPEHGHGIALSTDGRRFAMFQSASRLLLGWDYGLPDAKVRQGRLVGKLHGNLCSWDAADTLCIMETATGEQTAVVKLAATAVAFSPDGTTLAVATPGGDIVLWDMAAAGKAAARAADDFGPLELEELWTALAGAPRPAQQAVHTLAALGNRAVAFLRNKITLPPPPDPKRWAALIEYLADAQPVVRDLAQAQLEACGEAVLPLLRESIKNARAPARTHLEQLAAKLAAKATGPERLRYIRALQAVEQIGTPPSRSLLEVWSAGPAHSLLAQDARSALERLRHR
jgi:WD40 repeat protein